MAHDPQRQSPVLSQVVEVSEAHVASLPMHARRKLSRLAIQVALAFPLKLSQEFAVSVVNELLHRVIAQPALNLSVWPAELLRKAWVLLRCLCHDHDLVKALQPRDTQQIPRLQSTIKRHLGIEGCPPYLSILADGLIQGLAGCR